MRSWRSTAAAIVTVLALAAVSSCNGSSGPSGATGSAGASASSESSGGASAAGSVTKLNFWGGWTGPDGDVMHGLVDKFNAAHPNIQVTLTTQQWTPLFDKFELAVKSGNQPDILAMHGVDIPQFAAAGQLEDLTSGVGAAGFKPADFAKQAWDGTIYQGKQYAFPLDLHMEAVYYNTDLFKAASLTPPTDWISGQDFLKLATALTVDASGKHPSDPGFDASKITQYGLALQNNHHGFYLWYALVRAQNETLLNGDQTQVAVSDAAGTAAWQWIQDLVFKYHVAPVGETSQLQDFLSGKTAMLLDGPWEIPAMQKQAGLNWGTFPVPQVFQGKAAWGSGHVLTIPKQSDATRETAAETVATWIVQNSAAWGNSGNLPALNSARLSPDFTSLPGRAGFLAELPYEVMLPAIPAGAQVFSAAKTSAIVVASQAIMVQDQPIESTMQKMIQAMNSLLAGQ